MQTLGTLLRDVLRSAMGLLRALLRYAIELSRELARMVQLRYEQHLIRRRAKRLDWKDTPR